MHNLNCICCFKREGMRVIKFRAFHIPTKKMFDVFSWCKDCLFEDSEDGVGTSPTLPAEAKDCILMQFTGLQDKNGIDIYEGDVVKYYQPYAKKYNTHAILWDEKFAGFGLFILGNEWCKESDWIKIQNIEVLGNIHETPELL